MDQGGILEAHLDNYAAQPPSLSICPPDISASAMSWQGGQSQVMNNGIK